jgi:hypothetical protein
VNETSVDLDDPRHRGFVLALSLLGAEESVLQAVDETQRGVLAGAWRGLRALDEEGRARTTEAWRKQAASGRPVRFEELHPSWGEEALAGERPAVVAALRAAPGSPLAMPAEIAGGLARVAFGGLAPLGESKGGALADGLCRLELEALLSELSRRGARTVGHSLSGAAPPLRAKAMAAVGEPWAQEIAAGCLEESTPAQREAATTLAGTVSVFAAGSAVDRLAILGLASLKVELQAESHGSCLQVAGRLPAPLGRVLAGW